MSGASPAFSASFLGKPPDLATIEDLRRFQIDQHECAVGPASINGAVSALRFLFGVTLGRPEMALGLVVVRFTPKLRVVLSGEETARLLEAVPGIKYKAALSVAYGAGLRRLRALADRLQLMGVAAVVEEPEPGEQPDYRPPCPCCGGHMTIIETFARWCQPRAPPTAAFPAQRHAP